MTLKWGALFSKDIVSVSCFLFTLFELFLLQICLFLISHHLVRTGKVRWKLLTALITSFQYFSNRIQSSWICIDMTKCRFTWSKRNTLLFISLSVDFFFGILSRKLVGRIQWPMLLAIAVKFLKETNAVFLDLALYVHILLKNDQLFVSFLQRFLSKVWHVLHDNFVI